MSQPTDADREKARNCLVFDSREYDNSWIDDVNEDKSEAAIAAALAAERKPLEKARTLVNQQAEDPGLWLLRPTAVEQYLIQALRELHRAVEGGE